MVIDTFLLPFSVVSTSGNLECMECPIGGQFELTQCRLCGCMICPTCEAQGGIGMACAFELDHCELIRHRGAWRGAA